MDKASHRKNSLRIRYVFDSDKKPYRREPPDDNGVWRPVRLLRLKDLRVIPPREKDEVVQLEKCSLREVWLRQGRQPDMGAPHVQKKRRGRPPKKISAQSDWSLALAPFLALDYRRTGLPKLRTGTGYVPRAEIEKQFRELHEAGIPRRKWIRLVMKDLELRGLPCPDASTLRKIRLKMPPNFQK